MYRHYHLVVDAMNCCVRTAIAFIAISRQAVVDVFLCLVTQYVTW